MYEYRCKLLRIIDGDTLELDVDLGWDVHIIGTVRLSGIDAPENRGITKIEGRAAQLWLMSAVRKREPEDPAPTLTIRTKKDKTGKYGRMLAELFVQGDPASVNVRMVEAGHAKVWR
jgi:micrococcal nuclease